MAALDGIQNKIPPGEPLDRDIYEMSPEELAKTNKTPGSLEEALCRPRRRPRLPDQGRRLHRRHDRDVDLVEAREGNRPDAAPPASVRILAVLRQLTPAVRRPRRRRLNDLSPCESWFSQGDFFCSFPKRHRCQALLGNAPVEALLTFVWRSKSGLEFSGSEGSAKI